MAIYTRGKSKIYWVRFAAPDGSYVRESAQTADKRAAEEFEVAYRARLWRESKLGEVNKTFGEAAAVWLSQKERGPTDRYNLRALLNKFGTNMMLKDITVDGVRVALEDKKGPNRNRYITQITAILNLASRLGWLDRVPKFLRTPEAKPRIRWLTPAEWVRLQAALEEIAPHLLELARFSIYTGVRAHNALGLKWQDVDMKRAHAVLHPDQTKAGHGIGVPLSKDAMVCLRRQQGYSDEWVFPYGDKPVARTSNHGWKSAKIAAKVENFRWHDLRHTWASWHVQSGTPLNVLQQLGGWQSYEMVLVYAHLAPKNLKQFIKGGI